MYVVVHRDGTCQPLDNVHAGALLSGGTVKLRPDDSRPAAGERPSAADFLTAAFERGWQPLRETSMGEGAVLVLLQRG
jgi:hypothetical protein